MASALKKKLPSLDDDDDLEDFLSNILNDTGKSDKSKIVSSSQPTSSSEARKNSLSHSIEAKTNTNANNGGDDDDEFEGIFQKNNSEPKKPEPVRPPTRSGPRFDGKTQSKEKDDSDDDFLDTLGLGSPKKGGTKPSAVLPTSTNVRSLMNKSGTTSSKKKVLDSLLGFDDFDQAEIPGQSTNKDTGKKDKTETKNDSLFGGYLPSAMSTSRSATNKRLVRFESKEKSFGEDDEDDDVNPKFLSTAPASLFSNSAKNDEPDWLADLDLGSTGSKGKQEQERPRSVGSTSRGNSFDVDEFLGSSKKKTSEDVASQSVEAKRRKSNTNILKLDVDDYDRDHKEIQPRRPSTGGRSTPLSSGLTKPIFNLDFLNDLDEDKKDGGALKTTKNQKEETKQFPRKSAEKMEDSDADHLMNQIKHLEAEKEFLLSKIERMKEQFDEEKKLIVEALLKRIQLAEETFEKCQERLKQENDILSQDLLDKVRSLEKEKSEMFSSQLQRMSELEREKKEEMDRLKNSYRSSIENIKEEHEDSLQRILKTKNQELDVVMASKDHMKKLETALTYLEVNTADLDHLKNKVGSKVDEAEFEQQHTMKMKESSLKALEKRVTDKEKEMEEEKKRLLGLISKLEKQLADQNAQIEQEKWQLRQNETSLRTERGFFEKEKSEFLETNQRERLEIEKAKSKLASERKSLTSELNKEKISLAEEKARLEIEYRMRGDEKNDLHVTKVQSEIEVSTMKRALTDKLNEVEKRLKDLMNSETRIAEEKKEINEKRREMEKEKKILDKMAHQLNQSSKELVQKYEELEAQKEQCKNIMASTRSKETELARRFETVQKLSRSLESREDKIIEDRLALAQERSRTMKNSEIGSFNYRTEDLLDKFDTSSILTPAEKQLYDQLSNGFVNNKVLQSEVNPLSEKLGVYIQDWKISSQMDMNYLENERYFIEAIKSMSSLRS